MKEYTAKVEDLWLKGASKGFVRIPYWLIVHYRVLGLSEKDFLIVSWIAYHQRSQKAAFPHPAKLAVVLGVSTSEAVLCLESLRDTGLITLEATLNNSGNFHQDLRPLRNKLHELVGHLSDPSSLTDGSIKVASIQKDASIPDASILQEPSNRGSTSSINDVLKKTSSYKKKKKS